MSLLRRNIIGLIAAALVVAYAAAGTFNVEPDETGVAFLFGRAVEPRLEPGLHWNPPRPFGRVVVARTATNLTVPIGYAVDPRFRDENIARASDLWLTGGSSLVRARLDIQYTVSDLRALLTGSEAPTEMLRAAAERVATRIFMRSSVDDILTNRRQILRQDIQAELQELIDAQGLGLEVRAVDIVEMSPPPDGEVDLAFQQVQSARSDRERTIQDALARQSQITSAAAAQARETEERARADRFARVEVAKGRAARFTALAKEHAAAPAMTEQRLYLERMETLLPRAQLYVVEPGGAVRGVR